MAENKTSTSANWTSTQAYVLAIICLVAGVAIGYLVRGSAGPSESAATTTAQAATAPTGAAPSGAAMPNVGSQPTPEQMKQMADTQAAPLLAQLKSDPNNAELLYKVGNIYYDTQQFPDAVKYYESSLKINPKATDVRTDMGTAYHFMGQTDRALAEYDEVLKANPNHANALFNQGMVRWQDKMDMKGAIVSWKKLLATNPDYPKRDQVQELISKAEEHLTIPPGTKTNKPADIQK